MLVKKTEVYKVGVGGVRAILQDKIKSVAFENGEAVEVDEKQFEILVPKLGWAQEVKDAINARNSDKDTKDRVTPTVKDK